MPASHQMWAYVSLSFNIMKSEAYGESALRFHVPAMQSGQAEEKLAVERE